MFRWIRKSAAAGDGGVALETDVTGIRLDPAVFHTVYAIGDIHGRLDLLREIEARIVADIQVDGGSLVIYLGDYVDRGPDSAGVVDHLRIPETPKFTRLCLRGNHDDVFQQFLVSPLEEAGWLDMGGRETLLSYGLKPHRIREAWQDMSVVLELLRTHVPPSHRDFLRTLPHFACWGSFVFVHAGLQPGVSLEKQVASDLLWIREPFLSIGPELPVTVVHGHTPKEEISYGPGRIGIDTGAYATGRLTVLKITESGAVPLL